MRRLVIVRPEPGASATARAAATTGLDPVILPLFEVRPLEWKAPDPAHYDALLLTSANASRHAGDQLERLKTLTAHCVGDATAASARAAGLSVGQTGNGGVGALLRALSPELKLLHLCGADRKASDEAVQSIDALPVYESVEVAQPLVNLSGSVVLLHSPRAASAFARRAGPERSTIAMAAISPETAEAAGGGWEHIEVASEPTDAELLAIASRLCNKRP